MITDKAMGEYGERDRHHISYNQVKWINSFDQNNGRWCLRSSLSFWVLSKETCLWKWGHNHVGHGRLVFHGPNSIKLSAESFVGINDNITKKWKRQFIEPLCCLLMFALWTGTMFYMCLFLSSLNQSHGKINICWINIWKAMNNFFYMFLSL